MKTFWTSAALVPTLSMWVALAACGASPDEAPDDVREYCASVDYADEICDEIDAAAEPSDRTPAEQTAGVDGWL